MPKILKKLTKQKVKAVASIALCALLLNSASAQSWRYFKKRGDDQFFNEKNYYGAAVFYKRALSIETENTDSLNRANPFNVITEKPRAGKIAGNAKKEEILLQLAESCRLYKNYREALIYYQEYLENNKDAKPEIKIWYAYCLNANNNPQQALDIVKKVESQITNNSDLQELCSRIKNTSNFLLNNKLMIQNYSTLEIHQMPQPVNTIGANFSNTMVDSNAFLFATTRQRFTKKKKTVTPVQLYYYNRSTDNAYQIPVCEDLNIATPTLSEDKLLMFFTGWITNKNNKNQYSIYYCTRNSVDEGWSVPLMLDSSVNAKGFNSKDPFVTPDKSQLFFSSNKTGYGSFDLWWVPLKNNLPDGASHNLGDSVNTNGNEVSPYYDVVTKTLYYSSDGKLGMGGLDIYRIDGSTENNVWKNNQIMPTPINSVKDDVYYFQTVKKDSVIIYLSSDRNSDCCLSIYSIAPLSSDSYTKIFNGNSSTTASDNLASTNKVIVAPAIIENTTPSSSLSDNSKTKNGKTEKESIDDTNEQLEKERIAREKNHTENEHLQKSKKTRNATTNSAGETIYTVNHNFNKDKVRNENKEVIDDISKQLQDDPSLNIVVASFTDCKGSRRYNLRLARKRAREIRRQLRVNHIASARVRLEAIGEKYLSIPCSEETYDSAAQIVNRKSELILTKSKNRRWSPENYIENTEPDKAYYAKKSSRKQSNMQSNNAQSVSVRYLTPEEKMDAITKRTTAEIIDMPVNSSEITLELYDNGVFDHDSISVTYQNKLLVNGELLRTDKSIKLAVRLTPSENGNENKVTFFADNEGDTAPNSALLVVTDATGKRQEINVSSNLKQNIIIRFQFTKATK